MENKEITIYELMGLIKDNKAPKKIKYDGIIYAFDKELNDYYNSDRKIWSFLYHRLGKAKNCVNDFLNDTVEILPEENDEWEDIREIVFLEDEESSDKINRNFEIFADEFNKLIKNQKRIIEKLEEK